MTGAYTGPTSVCVREGRDSGEITQPREILESVGERETELFRMEGRFGRHGEKRKCGSTQDEIRKGEEEKECVRGCSEREGEIVRKRKR